MKQNKSLTFLIVLFWIAIFSVYAFAEQQVTLRFVYCGTSEPEKAWSVEYKQDFEKRNPNIRIEYMYIPWADQEKKIAVMTQANDYPDIIQVQDVTNLTAMGVLEPLDNYIDDNDSAIKRDNFYPAAFDYSIINGSLYSIPAHMTVYGLIVNNEMLNKYGFTLDGLKTWDNIFEIGQKISQDNIYAYGYAAGLPRFSWRDALIAGYSNDVLISDISPESKDKYLEVLNYYNMLKPYIPPAAVTWSYPEMFRAFCQEQVAMVAAGSFYTSNVYSIDPQIVPKSRTIVYPKGPSSDVYRAMVANAAWSILEGSNYKNEAWFVIQDLLEKENAAKEAAVVGLPTRNDIGINEFADLAGEYYPDIKEANKQIIEDFLYIAETYGVSLAKILHQSEMEIRFQENMYQMLTDKLTPEEFYEKIKIDIEEVIK